VNNFQLDLDFAGYDQPNACGVYADCERIVMPRKGIVRAELRVAFTAAGFCWGSSAMLEQEGYAGMPNVSDIRAERVVATKADAIDRACDEVRRHVGRVQTKGARCVLDWVESVRNSP
jgi:hypothetical protein